MPPTQDWSPVVGGIGFYILSKNLLADSYAGDIVIMVANETHSPAKDAMYQTTLPGGIGGADCPTRVMLWDSVSEMASAVAVDADERADRTAHRGGKTWTETHQRYKQKNGELCKDEYGLRILLAELQEHICERAGFIGRSGFKGFGDAAKAALSCWPEGIQIVEQMLEEIYRGDFPQPTTTRRLRQMSCTNGQLLDVERMRRGKPFWKTNKRRKVVGPTHLTIITDVSAGANVDHRDIMWRGAASIALMDVLERNGYRCEHWAAKRTNAIGIDLENGGEISELQAVRTKCQGEPLDLMAQVNTVSGWYMRTIFFGAKSLTGHIALGENLGNPAEMSDADILAITNDSRVLVSQGILSYRDAVDWVSGSVRRYIERGRVGVGAIDRGKRNYRGGRGYN